MAYENEVRRQAGALTGSSQSMQKERNRISSEADGARQWWKGKGGEAFAKGYQEIDENLLQGLKDINRAVDGLARLPVLIQRAEQERRRAAEKQQAK